VPASAGNRRRRGSGGSPQVRISRSRTRRHRRRSRELFRSGSRRDPAAGTGRAPGGPPQIRFQDEAGVGRQGRLTRIRARRGTGPARAPRDTRCRRAHLSGAVCPARGAPAGLPVSHLPDRSARHLGPAERVGQTFLGLPGWVAPAPVDELEVDNARCMGLGLPAGISQMTNCMRTASNARQVEKDRQTRSQIQADRSAAEQKAESDRRTEAAPERQRQDVNGIMSGNGDPFDIMTARKPPDPSPLPRAAAIPGLVCTGEDDDASRDARSEDQSALRSIGFNPASKPYPFWSGRPACRCGAQPRPSGFRRIGSARNVLRICGAWLLP